MLLDRKPVTRTAYQPVLKRAGAGIVMRRNLDQVRAQHDHQEQIENRSSSTARARRARQVQSKTIGAPTT